MENILAVFACCHMPSPTKPQKLIVIASLINSIMIGKEEYNRPICFLPSSITCLKLGTMLACAGRWRMCVWVVEMVRPWESRDNIWSNKGKCGIVWWDMSEGVLLGDLFTTKFWKKELVIRKRVNKIIRFINEDVFRLCKDWVVLMDFEMIKV